MNQMEIFKNPEFGSIRVIEENGKYLFSGTDVAAALGYSNPRDAIIRHCRYVVKRDAPHPQSPDRKISMTFIPEGDLYRLIVHSKLPSAEQFERWVFDEVLPTIRKHGAYLTKEKLWEVATSPEALMKLCSDLLAEREANISLRKENAQLEGKAAFYDLFIDLKHSTNLRTTAKELDVPERRFVRFLIERRFVYRTASGNVLPYANVKNAGLFCVKDYCNHGHTGSYTLVTPQGKLYFAQLREMIAKLRREISDIALRTTLISGFPGETQEDHEELMTFVDEMEFERLGVFAYSAEEDTPAYSFPDQVPQEVKEERRDEIMQLQQEIAFEKSEDMVGRVLTVLIEGKVVDEPAYVGRTYMDAPGVDGLIFVNADVELMSGDFVRVRVTGSAEYDLIGEIYDESAQ